MKFVVTLETVFSFHYNIISAHMQQIELTTVFQNCEIARFCKMYHSVQKIRKDWKYLTCTSLLTSFSLELTLKVKGAQAHAISEIKLTWSI